METQQYNRDLAVQYAHTWAYDRNPKYYNYDKIGGDCTNFVSQCIYAGTGVMNYNSINGWYYKNANNKSPSWKRVILGYQTLHNALQKSSIYAIIIIR